MIVNPKEEFTMDLSAVNAGRKDNLITRDAVLVASRKALESPDGWAVFTTGYDNGSKGYTQIVCLAVARTDGQVRIGFADADIRRKGNFIPLVTGLPWFASPAELRAWADQE